MAFYKVSRCRLRSLLDERKMTLRDLEKLTGIPYTSLRRYEKATRLMPLDAAYTVMIILNLDRIEDLYDFEPFK